MKTLFNLQPTSKEIEAYLKHLASLSSSSLDPEVKAYSDAVYFNYFSLGLSLAFEPTGGYKAKSGSTINQLDQSRLRLKGIDIYNVPREKTNTSRRELANALYSPYPISPILIPVFPKDKDGKARATSVLEVADTMTGKDFVEALGEPDRKGGGSGPSSGSIGIWLEWSQDGLMLEFGGDESRGPQAWEKGKDAVWSVLSLFLPVEK